MRFPSSLLRASGVNHVVFILQLEPQISGYQREIRLGLLLYSSSQRWNGLSSPNNGTEEKIYQEPPSILTCFPRHASQSVPVLYNRICCVAISGAQTVSHHGTRE